MMHPADALPPQWAPALERISDAAAALPEQQAEDLLARVVLAHRMFEHTCGVQCSQNPLAELLRLCARDWDADGATCLAVLWLATAARLPSATEVEDAQWQLTSGSSWSSMPDLTAAIRALASSPHRFVLREIPEGDLLVDVTHTFAHPWFLTGIQRVVRGLVAGLRQRTPVTLVHVVGPGRLALAQLSEWDQRLLAATQPEPPEPFLPRARHRLRTRAIHTLLAARRPLAARIERDPAFANSPPVAIGRAAVRALIRGAEPPPPAEPEVQVLLIRRGGRLLLPELTVDGDAIETVLRWQHQLGARTSMVFYDAIPITHAHYFVEDHAGGLVAGYAKYTRLLRGADHVLPISHAATGAARSLVSFDGSASGEVTAVPLPGTAVAGDVTRRQVNREHDLLLCVSSIEPRKNHVRLLRAARLLHEQGVLFRLVLVGRTGWHVARITTELERARRAGVAVELREAVQDSELSELYDAARAVVFVSEVEGYGLPIVEALAHGTPVVCSNTGSMAEVAAAGGCVTVDQLDISSIAAALGAVLTDDTLHSRLTEEAARRPRETWQDYADEVLRAIGHSGDPVEEAPRDANRGHRAARLHEAARGAGG